MSNTDNSKATPTAIKNADTMWNNFLRISQICGSAIVIALILMAIFIA